jgi:phospholipase/carboxylesterase
MEAVEIETGSPPQAAVIWLHGLGADGHDFEPIVPELRLKQAVRFVFPHAPVQPVTINQGMRMRAWYDIFQLGSGPDGAGGGRREDDKGIRASQALIVKLIEEQPVPPEKIVLAGFSQGGAIALQTALRYPKPLAGVMALSTYLPLAATLAAERSAANAQIPIFMAHGQYDDIIPMQRARASREALQKVDYKVEWHEYPMPHSVCGEEVRDISAFLAKLL